MPDFAGVIDILRETQPPVTTAGASWSGTFTATNGHTVNIAFLPVAGSNPLQYQMTVTDITASASANATWPVPGPSTLDGPGPLLQTLLAQLGLTPAAGIVWTRTA